MAGTELLDQSVHDTSLNSTAQIATVLLLQAMWERLATTRQQIATWPKTARQQKGLLCC
jgi:hypothetical protein